MIAPSSQTRIQEQTKFWRIPQYDNMELLHATYVTHVFPRHFHEWYAIGMIERNNYTFYHDGAMRDIAQGQVVVINPGEIHSGHALMADGWTYRMFYPGVSLMRRIAYEATGKYWSLPAFGQSVIDDPALAKAMQHCHRVLEKSDMHLLRDTLLRDVLGQLIVRHAVNSPRVMPTGHERQAVVAAKRYMRAHYTANITLEELAQHVGLSPYHLARVFKQETGLPPHTYLVQLRVEVARMFMESGMAISDAALMCGFTDQSHLSRHFKRILGVTPGQYINQS